jgi:hypothetical protein
VLNVFSFFFCTSLTFLRSVKSCNVASLFLWVLSSLWTRREPRDVQEGGNVTCWH